MPVIMLVIYWRSKLNTLICLSYDSELFSLLMMDPSKRFTCEQALEHKYLEYLHCPRDEPCGPNISRGEFEFERQGSTIEELKQEILREIEIYHRGPPPETINELSEEFEAKLAAESK